MSPSRGDRQIDTTNLHVLFGKRPAEASRWQYGLGFTLTNADGYMEREEAGVMRRHDTGAWGAGPAMQVRWAAWQGSAASLWLQASGAVLLYSEDFPYGGDRYNFMWRAGPALQFKLGPAATLNLQYHWMHVSNGQGSGDHNPAYDAHGASLGVSVPW
ncbi:acyloxyacyl hydrolase [Uliginosibacterium sp. H1]|uniref:acyloxyacyl hydrolase n=1 Tax=Uliginosibacterium sp. H1 TaxID=3114757 RepID=UPI002E17AC23|nr:acyloxyacyl hydrolase [Uliginosibacterium sp. H1]